MQFELKTLREKLGGNGTPQARNGDPTALLGDVRNVPSRFDPQNPLCGSGWAIEKILVPTDFSPGATRALDRAVALAREFNARLTILHVVDVNTAPRPGESASQLMDGLWDAGFRKMAELVRPLTGQVDAKTVFEEGLPWEEIVEKSRDADLAILGKNDSRSRWSLFSNHTADRVVKCAACPVLLVSSSETDYSLHFYTKFQNLVGR